jgi:hypothetical protein
MGRLALNTIRESLSHVRFFRPLLFPQTASLSIMSYKAGIVKAISELKERNGSSSIAIKKHMQVSDYFTETCIVFMLAVLVLFILSHGSLVPSSIQFSDSGKHARGQEMVEC